MAYIAPGDYRVGDDSGRADERPAHIVQLCGFWAARTPVTNQDYASYLVSAGSEPPRFWREPDFMNPRQPVVGVRWDEALDYCAWLSSELGRSFRLPSEAEWEVASRGGRADFEFPWGSASPSIDGVALAQLPQVAPLVVGLSPANGYGLQDFCFNIHEWCLDWYDPLYYEVSPACDPSGPVRGKRRSSRGGAWRHQIKVSRCAARSSLPPEFQYNDYGFRVFGDEPEQL
jgi:formylglycine-generating enzyme required for sulfatase activity